MTLPAENSTWPPAPVAAQYARMKRLEAWYSGDPAKLSAVYAGTGGATIGGPATTVNPQPGIARRIASAVRGEFWGSVSGGEVDTKRHLPVAQDVATISSELLFAEQPIVHVQGPTETVTEQGREITRPSAATQAAQAELERVLEANDWQSTLLAAAEIASALGAAGLRLAIDAGVQHPILARVDADAMIPTYSWGRLVSVAFWRVVALDKGGTVLRHIEDHQNDGMVVHALYKGTATDVGKRVPLESHPATAQLADVVGEFGEVRLAPEGQTAASIPNMLPDPLDRSSSFGRSDYTPAALDLADAIDKLYSQMMEEADDARSRLFIASSLLNDGGPGRGLDFDPNQRLFHKTKTPPTENGSAMPIEQVQFEMRLEQYLTGIEALSAKFVRACGYNAQTMGDESGDGEMTATEYTGRNRRSMSTRDKKGRYWTAHLSRLLTTMLAMHVERFKPRDSTGALIQAFPVLVTLPEAVQQTELELAAVAKAKLEAGAASIETRVRQVNPSWSELQIMAEVDKLQPVDPVTLGAAGRGVGPGDGI